MKKPRLLILLILISGYLQSQTDSTISFIAYWNIGDQYKYELVKEKYREKNGEVVKNDSNTYLIDFKVIDSTKKSYTINWKYNNYLKDTINVDQELANIIKELEKIEINYDTDELGSFLQIHNWKDIKKTMERLEKYLIDINPSSDSINLKRLMKPMEKAYKSEEGIQNLLFDELQYFHWLFGIELNIYDTLEYEDFIPNILGGEPFRTNSVIYFDSIDFENTTCSVIQKSSFNQADFQSFMKTLIDDIISRTSTPKEEREKQIAEMKTVLNNAEISIEDLNYYVIDYYYGVPIYIYSERYFEYKYQETRIEQKSSVEIILIE
jgi:hypothetical protein